MNVPVARPVPSTMPADPVPPFASPPGGWAFAATQIDLRQLGPIIYRNRRLIIAVCLAGLLIGLAVTLLTTPTYRGQASIQIDQQATQVLDTPDVEPVQAIQDADRFLQTQLEIIQSRSLAIRVAQTLGLFRDDHFLEAMHVRPADAPVGALSLREARREQVIQVLQDHLRVNLPNTSRIASIAFDSPDPRLAARIANAFAQNMIDSNLDRKFNASSYARTFLRDQLQAAKERLENSERDMVIYAREAGIVDTSAADDGAQASGPRSLTASSLVQINEQLSAAQAQRIEAQQRWENARRSPPMNLPEVLSNSAIQGLAQHRAELEATYAQQRQQRKADFPEVKRLGAEIAEIDSQIAALAGSIRDSIRNQFLVAQRQEQQLQGTVSALKGATLSEQGRAIRYNILRREVSTNRELYDGLLQRYKEISAAAGISANNIAMVDIARVPAEPISPNLAINLALAALVSLILTAMLVYAREHFDDVVRSSEDVERKLSLSPLGMVPVLDKATPPLRALELPFSPFAEAYHAVRSAIELSTAGGLPRTLLITSSRGSEGKSTSAFAIARDFARTGRKVLLIDGDLRRPSLHKVLSLPNERGLVNLLARQSTLADTVQPTPTAGLDFVGSGPLSPNPAELLGSAGLSALFGEFCEHYQLVIIDGPPVVGLADAPTLAAHVDATLFVVDSTASRPGMIKAAIRRLQHAHAHILGVILNKFDVKTAGYQYGYDQYYNYARSGAGADGDAD